MFQRGLGSGMPTMRPASVDSSGEARGAGSHQRPAVLVSVRNVSEASAALAGGCDLLDVKAPERGPLGRPDADVVCEILRLRDARAPQVPVSMALGELRERLPASGDLRAAAVWRIPDGVAYVKVGLSGLRQVANWQDLWRQVRRSFGESEHARLPQWVAVAYADSHLADAPTLEDVVTAARVANCAGVLVDTWCKASGGLLSHLSLERLQAHLERVSQAGLLTALAGRLSLEDAVKLANLPVDIIAIRSAACRSDDRLQEVCERRVTEFCEALLQASHPARSVWTSAAHSEASHSVTATAIPGGEHGFSGG